MKPYNYFWGVFFVSLGLFFLLNNLHLFQLDYYDVWEYWPLLLIFWGISFLDLPRFMKSIFSAIAGLFVAFLIIGLMFGRGCATTHINLGYPDNNEINSNHFNDSSFNNYNLPVPAGLKLAKLTFNGGAGKFFISDTTNFLINVRTRESFESTNLTSNIQDSIAEINVESNFKNLFSKKSERASKVMLNTQIPYEIELKTGASKLLCDFTQYITRSISLDAGASSIYLKIGARSDTTDVEFDVGASAVVLLIPFTSGCNIVSETGLSSNNFNGFHKIGEDVWQTEKFDSCSKKIFLKISGGVSSFKVERY